MHLFARSAQASLMRVLLCGVFLLAVLFALAARAEEGADTLPPLDVPAEEEESPGETDGGGEETLPDDSEGEGSEESGESEGELPLEDPGDEGGAQDDGATTTDDTVPPEPPLPPEASPELPLAPLPAFYHSPFFTTDFSVGPTPESVYENSKRVVRDTMDSVLLWQILEEIFAARGEAGSMTTVAKTSERVSRLEYKFRQRTHDIRLLKGYAIEILTYHFCSEYPASSLCARLPLGDDLVWFNF